MQMQSCYAVLMTEQPLLLADFYRTHFGFVITFEMDWYVSLKHDSGPWELALLRYDHPTVPAMYRATSQGMLLNIEVGDANAEYQRLVLEAGVESVLELRDESFGQRHFIVKDPAGNLIDVIQNITPDTHFAAAYSGQ